MPSRVSLIREAGFYGQTVIYAHFAAYLPFVFAHLYLLCPLVMSHLTSKIFNIVKARAINLSQFQCFLCNASKGLSLKEVLAKRNSTNCTRVHRIVILRALLVHREVPTMSHENFCASYHFCRFAILVGTNFCSSWWLKVLQFSVQAAIHETLL